ncbi:Putative purine permease ygfU [Gluconacetobacter sp. SXCC-1]|nr:Putative purine permease ygfU [Gluconacetobacter sp. SXCC-1]
MWRMRDGATGVASSVWVCGIDDVPSPLRLFIYALQHVMVLYAGAVAVPLILATALHFSAADTSILVCASLATSGIATLIQVLGLPHIGSRLPAIQATSFVCLPPLLTISQNYGLPAAFGAAIAAGLITLVAAPVAGWALRAFTPIVISMVVLSIGLSLIPVSVNWSIAGGDGMGTGSSTAVAVGTAALILLFQRFLPGYLRSAAILAGIAVMTLLLGLSGHADWTPLYHAAWVGWIQPFHFGLPRFHLAPVLVMVLTMSVTLVETTGNCLILTKALDLPNSHGRLVNAFRADGLSTMIGGIFCGAPYTTFSQNTGLILLSGVASRFVVAAAGVLLIVLGACPKLGALISCVPLPVLGGASFFMFGMISVAGIQQIQTVDLRRDGNAITLAVGLGVSLLPVIRPDLFATLPPSVQLFATNGTVLCGVTCLVVQSVFRGGDRI